MQKIGLLCLMSRSQRGLIYSQHNYFCCIFKTACPFAIRVGLLVQHHKLEFSVEKWDYCIQRQGHSKGSKCQ